jgi:L-lactate dehydrogenase (cytochrome)
LRQIGSAISTPKLFQLYFHKDRGLTGSMIERCIAASRGAERKVGELLQHADRARGNHGKVSRAPTLSDYGITYTQSSRWQKLAAVPDLT